MRPSPFTGKFKKRQIKLDKQQQPSVEQNTGEDAATHLKPPSNGPNKMIKISKDKDNDKSKGKQPKKIIDTLKEQQKIDSKPSTSFKPNLQLKAGKKIKLSTPNISNADSKPQQKVQKGQSHYRPVLKPNLFKKGETNASQRNLKEEVIVEEPKKNTLNIEQQSIEASVSANHSISIAPKFKIKAKQEQDFPMIQEQPMQQTGPAAHNFTNLKIETREISMDPNSHKVSQSKIQKQQARAGHLKNLLNLEIDLFQQTLNISCVTSYEIYINKIKGGSLKNSNDQAFDEKSAISCQTLPLDFTDFTNQCPQDYHTDINSIVQNDTNQIFNRFITKVAPVFQELIKPANSVVMPPIFLLALKPEFKKLLVCPFPVFLYYSPGLGISVLVIGQKLYIAQNEIQTALAINKSIIAGCRDGTIYIWTGKNDKKNRLYRRVLQQTQTTNFQLPQHSTQDIDRFSVYRSCNTIVSLLCESSQSFISLDSGCRMIKWKIERNGHKTTLIPEKSYDFGNLIQRNSIIGYHVKKRASTYFISSSAGILIWNGEEIAQRLDTEGYEVLNFSLPHRTHYIYAICSDESLRIFDQNYTSQLYKVNIKANTHLVDIFVPETEYENKKLSLTAHIYLAEKSGLIHYLNILENHVEDKIINARDVGEQRAKDVIFRGVNKLSTGFELVSLWRDLKCTSSIRKMDVNLEPSVANLKMILQENRKVHGWLEGQNGTQS